MKNNFRQIVGKKRHRYHPLQHKIHRKHNLSRHTIFYMKEYGTHANVAKTIVRESIKILLLASIISSLGGVALESIRKEFTLLLPLVIAMPALNTMIGNFGTITASKFTTALFMGKVRGGWWHIHFLHRLFWIIFFIGMLSALYIAGLSIIVSIFGGFSATPAMLQKLAIITVSSAAILVTIIFAVSIIGGIWIYKKKEDPNNFLIPITTSIADFGSLMVFAYLVKLFF